MRATFGRAVSRRVGDPVAQIVGAIRQAKPVVALLGTDAPAVSAAVEGCLATLSGDPIRIVRVRGLPGVPLTLSRIVEEIGADGRNGPRADDDELIVRVLATRSRGEDQVVLLLEQAELLPLPTLVFLQVALTVFGARTPRLQLVFAGHPRFTHLIDRDELTPLRDRLEPVIRVPSSLASLGGAVTPDRVQLPGAAVQERAAGGPNRRHWAFVAAPALALAAVAVAATVGRDWYGAARTPVQAPSYATSAPVSPPPPAPPQDAPPTEPALPPQAAEPEAPAFPSREPDVAAAPAPPAPPSRDADAAAAPPPPQPQFEPAPPNREPDVAAAPAPSHADTAPPPSPAPPSRDADAAAALPQPQPAPPSRVPDAAAPPAPERRALPNSEQLARLRSDFDRFLSQTEWGSKRLSENERSRLFNEYLRWNYGTLAATPGSP